MEARAGNTTSALSSLEGLLQQYPNDARLLADTVIVANWDGDDLLALKLYGSPHTPKDDSGVVEAAARSARNLHQYTRAAELYRHAEAIAPGRWQPHLGEALVMIDQGDDSQAASLLHELLQNHRREKDVLRGEVYLCERQGDLACIIAMDEDLLKLNPGDSASRCELAMALSRLGGPTRALSVCSNPSAPAREAMREAEAAEYVRWGETYNPERKAQIAESTVALAKLNDVIAHAASGGATWREAQFDRILAFYDLERPRNVVTAYERLRKKQIKIPNYVLSDVAGAYSQLHQSDMAATLYRAIIVRTPQNGEAWSGLAYAEFDGGHISQSFATIDRAHALTPVWLQSSGLRIPLSNRMYTSLYEQSALMRGYAGLLAEEYRRQKTMLGLAPANAALRRDLALTDLARGWPLRAITESAIADSYAEPDEIPSLASVEIREAVGQRDVVDSMLPVLQRREFDNPELQRFVRGMKFNRGWQFDAQAGYGWGSGVEVGSNDNHSEAHLYSPFLDNRFRIYGHELSDGGEFITQTATHTRSGVGLRYEYSRKAAWGEFAYDFGTDRYAGNVGAQVGLGNFWSAAAEFDSDSFDVPTRALTGNIHGRSADINVDWHANESTSASVHLQRVLFSDGNQRTAWPVVWSERIFTTPRLQGTLRSEEWSSQDSRDENRPYFNPSADFSLGPRFTLDWLTWEHFAHSLTQEFGIYASPYWQQNYGTGGSAAVHYGQQWGLRDGVALTWGLTWNTQPYDGVNEHRTALEAGIRWGNQ